MQNLKKLHLHLKIAQSFKKKILIQLARQPSTDHVNCFSFECKSTTHQDSQIFIKKCPSVCVHVKDTEITMVYAYPGFNVLHSSL